MLQLPKVWALRKPVHKKKAGWKKCKKDDSDHLECTWKQLKCINYNEDHPVDSGL